MKDNKTCEHNWINKGTYKLCSVCGEIIQSSFFFAQMNGISPDVETDNYHFYQLEDEVEQSVPHQNDKRD